jgi:hypothetical protein
LSGREDNEWSVKVLDRITDAGPFAQSSLSAKIRRSFLQKKRFFSMSTEQQPKKKQKKAAITKFFTGLKGPSDQI